MVTLREMSKKKERIEGGNGKETGKQRRNAEINRRERVK